MTKVFIYTLSDNTGVRYVGKTINVKSRLWQHLNYPFKNYIEGFDTPKSRWVRKNKPEIFINIIEECNSDNWVEREIFWIDFYSKNSVLLNCTIGGEGGHGIKKSPEQIEKMRVISTGRKHTEETKRILSELMKENPPVWLFGQVPWNKGVKMSEEHKDKLSKSQKGRSVWNKGISSPSPMQGKKHSPETIEKLKAIKKEVTEETRKKMSEIAKKRCNKKLELCNFS